MFSFSKIRYNAAPLPLRENLNMSDITACHVKSLKKLINEITVGTSQSMIGCNGYFNTRYILKPAYKCDEWDFKLRLCILERNIGDTVTFYLSTGRSEGHRPNVRWRKEFHVQDSNTRKEFIINADNTPENIIIGRKGYELRISPITEIDLAYNLFSATLQGHSSPQHKVFFMIRIVPIDLGFVYVGETIELNLRSFVSLPALSMTFRWYMERDGEQGTLPSNMRTSASGSSIKISELRQEQEGILACSVYTNLDFLATKKRFLMKDLVKNNDILKLAPDHDLRFEEENIRAKRYQKKTKRTKREKNVDDIIEKALMQSTTTINPLVTLHGTTRSYDEYDVGKDIGTEESKIKVYESSLKSSEERRFQGSNSQTNSHRETQLSKHGYSSFINNPVIEGSEYNLGPSGNTRLQNINHRIPGELGSSAINHSKDPVPGGNSYKQYSNNEQSRSSGKFANSKNRQDLTKETDSLESISEEKTLDDNGKYVDFDSQNNNNFDPQKGESGIILNIDKIPGPRRISAAEKIAKLISSCYSDFECSANAICVRNNLKISGYCKCVPGFFGVGIFCREDIWISKTNFDMEEFHNLEDITYSNAAPVDNIDVSI